MLFHSATFIWGFLLPVLAVFYAAAGWAGARRALWVLVVASFVFYGWSHPAHVAILLGSIMVNYFLAGRLIAGRGTKRGKLFLVAGVTLNLAVLAWFKYALFFAGILRDTTGWAPLLPTVILPLGISFFTFQKIAYLIDAWRGRFTTQRWPDYALFVTFFPQLIAGPIVHHSEFIPQLHGRAFGRWQADRIVGGAAIFVLGLGKKILLADVFASHADAVFQRFSAAQPTGMVEGWGGVLAYTFQIYFDFSAYTDMAFGLALLFGITLPENFAAPYRATSIIEFWRRWHMTLSRFLRDYLYIPLGGSEGGRWRQAFNLMVVMVLGGLWHGAAWTFVAWGAWHGVALAVNHFWRRQGGKLPAVAGWIATFLTVATAWVFFRAESFAAAGRGLRALYGGEGLWPAGVADATIWLRAQKVVPDYYEFSELFGYLGLTGSWGGTGVEWRMLVFSAATQRVLWLVAGFSLVLGATPVIRWLWDLERARPRLNFWKALLVGAVIVAAVVTSGSTVPSTFIYFRF
ncbi:MAG: rane bound O-acyl transferase, family protein [Verrucomicrobia bacterium]|nr:rane bound O-acyl transferase, family protein [Verrucomicrobiota bacterium]